MLFRVSRLHWYDLVLISLAAMIVYPDKVAMWIGELLGRELNWVHATLISALGVCAAAGTMLWLMPMYPELKWQNLGIYLGALALFRALMSVVVGMFGFDD